MPLVPNKYVFVERCAFGKESFSQETWYLMPKEAVLESECAYVHS